MTVFGESVDVRHRGEHNEVPFSLKLVVTIWWLGNQETFRQIADMFGTLFQIDIVVAEARC